MNGFYREGCGYLPFLRWNIFILPVITAAVQQRGQFWQQLLPLFCRQRFALGVAERRGGDNFRSRNGAERVVIVGIAFSHQRICAAQALLKLINLQKHRAAARAGERFTLAVKGNFDTIIMLQRLNQGGGLAAVEAKMAVVFGLQRTAILVVDQQVNRGVLGNIMIGLGEGHLSAYALSGARITGQQDADFPMLTP